MMRSTGRTYRSKVFMVEEIPVEVAWKSVRNMNLRLGRDGMIHASVPRVTTIADARRLLEHHLLWMRKVLACAKERQGVPEMPRAVEGESVTFFGHEYKLHIVEGKDAGLSFLDGEAVLTVRPDSTDVEKSASLKAASRQMFQQIVEAHLPDVERQTGLKSSSWHIRDMKTRWGSCNVRTKRINLNLRLVQKPLICLDAVIAHELVHTKVSNHGREFYEMLSAVWPNWREAMAVLEGRSGGEIFS